jgi:acetyl/propionyl-CoA carboxylase alpha subunit
MIRTLLVANRGEIARRVFRTCAEMGITTVAVYSTADAHAPHVADADVAIPIGGPEPSTSYLDIAKIIDAARLSGADAIHPGYGFLSENADFAEACAAAGLTFIGPSPSAIRTMGSKLKSKQLMADAGVPTLRSIEITDGLDIAAAARDIGYPVLVKASAGGGGKGMRIVRSAAELQPAVDGAAREAVTAFGDGTVFIERYLEDPRHIEIQVFGDSHGTITHLFERECSIQRRHQKVIEEAPSPAVDEGLRERLGAAAIAAAAAVDYVGAGTVEFMLDANGEFSFLEMNTRLQVEHPVTEAITGLDLVRLQIEVADGGRLPPEALSPTMNGHAVEARLYAEDPAHDYLPVTGTVHRFSVEGARLDTGVEDGSEISIHYDPMIAKVIAHGPTRADAIRRLARALRSATLHGPTNNRALLLGILEHDEFAAGATDTGFLERHPPAELVEADRSQVVHHAFAAALAGQARRRDRAAVLSSLPSGWRNNPSQLFESTFDAGDQSVVIGYRLTGSRAQVTVDGDERPDAIVHTASGELVDLEWDGVRRTYRIGHSPATTYVDSTLGSSALHERALLPVPDHDVDPGSLLAPMPGKVVRVMAQVGDMVTAGQTLVVVEAMKMEHAVAAPANGVVAAIPVAEGDQVETDQTLAIVEETPD